LKIHCVQIIIVRNIFRWNDIGQIQNFEDEIIIKTENEGSLKTETSLNPTRLNSLKLKQTKDEDFKQSKYVVDNKKHPKTLEIYEKVILNITKSFKSYISFI